MQSFTLHNKDHGEAIVDFLQGRIDVLSEDAQVNTKDFEDLQVALELVEQAIASADEDDWPLAIEVGSQEYLRVLSEADADAAGTWQINSTVGGEG